MSDPATTHRSVGRSVDRREGRAKVTGAIAYVDDRTLPGMLYGKTIRSTIACGTIRHIEFEKDVPWDEFTIVDAGDVPGKNIVHLIEEDQPVLCEAVVRHREEPILLIAHPDRQRVEKAAPSVKITYEEHPAILEIGPGKVHREILIEDGDLEAEFAASDVVIERTYRTGAQEHAYIEPQGFIARWDGDKVHAEGSHQCPFYVHEALKTAFNLTDKQVNVAHCTTGGAFGGKEDFPSIVAIHAALLAKKSGRPVKLIYDRNEDMASSTKRHPSLSTLRIGATKDGVLRALDFDFRLDQGAYVTLTPVVLSRGVLHAFGCYRWPAARIRGRSFFTNSPPYGAFRGFGAPQSLFAIEAHMSLLAEQLSIDPAELRRRNFLRPGDTMPTGQVMKEDPNLEALLDRALELSDYRAKRSAWKKGSGRGIGLSTFMHGAGFTGSGEVYLASRVALEIREDGKVVILQANTEMGQGVETVFQQICSEAVGIPLEQVVFRRPETAFVPNSGPTVASRTTMIVGRLVEKAGKQLRGKLGELSVAEHYRKSGPLRIEVQYEPPPGIQWDEKTYKGSGYPTYAWACDVVEVSIDPVTAEIKTERVTSTVDIGTVINPTLAQGQVEGGVAQGVGWATSEKVALRDGAMTNAEMMNYIIPTTVDVPEITVEFLPNPYEYGAYGSKGVGELPMDGPAPAVTAAVAHALDREITQVPVQPEDLLE